MSPYSNINMLLHKRRNFAMTAHPSSYTLAAVVESMNNPHASGAF